MAYLIEYLEKLRDISHVKYSAQSFEYNKYWNLGYNNNNYYINFIFIILLLILLLLLFPSVDDFLLCLFYNILTYSVVAEDAKVPPVLMFSFW